MAFTIGTDQDLGTNLANWSFRQSNTALTSITAEQTLIDHRETFVSTQVGDQGGNSATNVPLNFESGGGLTVGGYPRGVHVVGNSYDTNHCVRVGDQWYRSTADGNTNTPPGANWQAVTIDYSRGALYLQGSEAFHNGQGSGQKIRFNNANNTWNMFNTVTETGGSIRVQQPVATYIDHWIVRSTNTDQNSGNDVIPYIRFQSGTNPPTGSYVGTLTLDGVTQPMGWYLANAGALPFDEGGLLPRDAFNINFGVIVGHAGGGSDGASPALRNIDATANRNDVTFLAANGAGGEGNWQTVPEYRVPRIINSADGADFAIGLRNPTGTGVQWSGQALIAKEMNFTVNDESGSAEDGVVIRIPVLNGTNTVGASGQELNFSPSYGSSNTDFVNGSGGFQSIDDAARGGTTDSNGQIPQQLMHIGYYQTPGTDSATFTRRVAAGTALFLRHGNNTTAFYSKYGFVPGASQSVSLQGINPGSASFEIVEDTSVTDRDNRPADTEVIFAENANNGFGNDDVISIANDISMDRVYDRIHAFQVDETVTGDGRNSFNQSTTGTLVDMGARFVRIDAIAGGEDNSEIRQGTIYTGMTNIQDLHINNGATIRADVGVRAGQSIYWTSGQGPALAVDGGDINGVLRLQAGNRTIQNCDTTNLTIERDQGETGDVVVTLINTTGTLPSILGGGVALATRITSPALSGGDDAIAVFDYTGGTLVSTTPIHTFTGAETVDQTTINGLGTTITRILTVYTSNTALPEIREHDFVSGETVTIAVTGTTDTLIPAVEPANVVNFSTDLSIDTSGANPVFVLRGAGFTQGGIDGHAYYNAYNVRNSATYREFLARTHVARTGALAGDGVNSYLTEDNRLVLSGSLVMTCSQNFLLTPMLVNPQAQVWAWDNRDGVQVGVGGIFGEVTGTGDFGGAEFSLADVDYPRIEQGQSDAVDTIVTEMQSTGVSLNDDAITDIGERVDTELRRSPATRGGRS